MSYCIVETAEHEDFDSSESMVVTKRVERVFGPFHDRLTADIAMAKLGGPYSTYAEREIFQMERA